MSKDKINHEIKELIKENPEESIPIIIQVKNKDLINKIKNKGIIKESLDEDFILVELKGEDINELSLEDSVIKIWPDRQTFIVLEESVPQINADYLWNLGYKGDNIKIAILDTGLDKNHEMLQGKVILERDFTNENDPNDYNGHGTHVAGIATGNGSLKGIAPNALIINAKVLDSNGYGQLSSLINAIDYVLDPDNNPETDDGADIISLSLGASYSGNPEDLLDAPEVLKIKEAINKNVIVVIASGNCAQGCGSFTGVTTPGITREAITVGAVDKQNNYAVFSSGDTILDYIKPDLTAPGVNICSSIPNGISCFSGTSMSTPHVSGAVALILQKNPNLNPFEIKEILERGALDLGEIGKDIKFGSGLVDLSNLEFNLSITPIIKDYNLIIPLFEVNKKDDIILEFNNTFDEKKKIKVVFNAEELDYELEKEFKKTINRGESEEFSYSIEFTLPGKHLLKIDIYDDKNLFKEDELLYHIEKIIDVSGAIEDNIAKYNSLLVVKE
ncbi:S8 family serine peptidase [Candidatus Woesearchaeota archaeon]|nr:S8 family serine peptidase [Candidatus Woesearchaeota archaeon]